MGIKCHALSDFFDEKRVKANETFNIPKSTLTKSLGIKQNGKPLVIFC